MDPNSTTIISDVFHLITSKFGGGLPSLEVMAVPLIIGVVVGYVLRKALKIGIALLIVAFIASYFGFISLASVESGGKALILKYGPQAQSYIAIFLGLVPLSIGLIIGIVIGFII